MSTSQGLGKAITGTLRDALLADAAQAAERHPGLVRPDWASRAVTTVVVLMLAGLFIAGVVTLDANWTRVWSGLGELARITGLMLPPEYGNEGRLLLWAKSLGETLAIAFLGTILAASLAFPFAFLAANNVVPFWLVRFSVKRGFDTFRGIDTLIWALIWINVVGLGPFAGVLAIMTSDFGALGKLFSEAIEAADQKPVEGVKSTGGTAIERVRFGLVPQILPVILSQVLYYIESNTRSATIIGIVGAGGIGLHLSEQIRTLEWQQASFLIIMVLVTVAAIDFVSSRLRASLISAGA